MRPGGNSAAGQLAMRGRQGYGQFYLGIQHPVSYTHLDVYKRQMVRWWWPGGDVTDAELRREVDLLDQANFGGAEIQPFTIGLDLQRMPEATRKRVDDYLTPTFYAHMHAALDEASAKGMWLDYTLGSAWPFGGAGVVTPALASLELRSAHQIIRGPVHFHQKILMPLLSASITTVSYTHLDVYKRQLQNRAP